MVSTSSILILFCFFLDFLGVASADDCCLGSSATRFLVREGGLGSKGSMGSTGSAMSSTGVSDRLGSSTAFCKI